MEPYVGSRGHRSGGPRGGAGDADQPRTAVPTLGTHVCKRSTSPASRSAVHTRVRGSHVVPIPAPPLPQAGSWGGGMRSWKKIGVETPELNGGFVLRCSSGAPAQPPPPPSRHAPGAGGAHSGAGPRCATPHGTAQSRATPCGTAGLRDAVRHPSAARRHAELCRHAMSRNDIRSPAVHGDAQRTWGCAQHSCPPLCPRVPVAQRARAPFPCPPLLSPCRTAHPPRPCPIGASHRGCDVPVSPSLCSTPCPPRPCPHIPVRVPPAFPFSPCPTPCPPVPVPVSPLLSPSVRPSLRPPFQDLFPYLLSPSPCVPACPRVPLSPSAPVPLSVHPHVRTSPIPTFLCPRPQLCPPPPPCPHPPTSPYPRPLSPSPPHPGAVLSAAPPWRGRARLGPQPPRGRPAPRGSGGLSGRCTTAWRLWRSRGGCTT